MDKLSVHWKHKSVETMATETNTLPISMATSEESPEIKHDLYVAYTAIAVFIVFFTMLAMGSGIELDQVRTHIKKPIGLFIGMICQFILMPLLAFGGAHAFDMEKDVAISMILVGSCPGGGPSNMFTFWSRGDLSLSVTMTSCSCVLALIFMPFNMFLYTRSWTDDTFAISFTVIVAGVLLTWIPLGLGVLIRMKSPAFADKFVRVGSAISMAMLIGNAVLQKVAYSGVMDSPWYVWFAAALMPLLGFSIGFGLSGLARLPIHQCRTIAFETGIQNVGLALAMIAVSFTGPEAAEYSVFPLYYLGMLGVESLFIVFCHRMYFRCSDKASPCNKICESHSAEDRKEYDLSPVSHDITAICCTHLTPLSGTVIEKGFSNGSKQDAFEEDANTRDDKTLY